ncbi:hypothetical protein PUN28_009617 [Cardiocondyla obscurior]|uniref:Ribosomal protein L20 n=1 Tax=Cardiocondyla obscurior TaxID=286306 RepID=A0AAW2FVI1_9HYME
MKTSRYNLVRATRALYICARVFTRKTREFIHMNLGEKRLSSSPHIILIIMRIDAKNIA